MGLLSMLVYSNLTLVIFLCLHRYFCAELRPAGSWAANHMPFTPETSFPFGPACNYSHLLISWIFGTLVQFLHLLPNRWVWWISHSKLLGLGFCIHFWDLFLPLVLVTSIWFWWLLSLTPSPLLFQVLYWYNHWMDLSPHSPRMTTKHKVVMIIQYKYSLESQEFFLLEYKYYITIMYSLMFLCVVYGLLPLKTIPPSCALKRKYTHLDKSLWEYVMFGKRTQNYTWDNLKVYIKSWNKHMKCDVSKILS